MLVDNIIKTNRYYARAESVVEAENLEGLFPIDEWEFLMGEATPLGVIADVVRRPTLPPSPGALVEEVDRKLLSSFLGLSEDGITIGNVLHHDIPASFSLNKLFQKHLAILAMSGAGKSYLTSVMIEELLNRSREQGRPSLVIFDVHGEYVGFAEKPPSGYEDFSGRCIAVRDVVIPAPELSAREISLFVPMSPAQVSELSKLLKEMEGKRYNFEELADYVSRSKINPKTKEALVRWLVDLHSTGLFGEEEKIIAWRENEKPEVYRLRELLRPGVGVIIDLSKYIDAKSRHIIALWIAKKIFNMRRRDEIPPTIIFLEEAHNFIPEGVSREAAPAKSIFETIAREGRKFLCSLVVISQRPLRLSTTVLSQCNTHIIMRITNPYDLRHIAESSEGITGRTLDSITTLQVGEALVVGEASRYPVFIRVRERRSWEKKSADMESEAKRFEERMEGEEAEREDYMEAFL